MWVICFLGCWTRAYRGLEIVLRNEKTEHKAGKNKQKCLKVLLTAQQCETVEEASGFDVGPSQTSVQLTHSPQHMQATTTNFNPPLFADSKLGSCCTSQQNRKFQVSSATFSNMFCITPPQQTQTYTRSHTVHEYRLASRNMHSVQPHALTYSCDTK